jgi:hypothetical protein
VNTVPRSALLRDRAQHITAGAARSPTVDLAVPRIHDESQDTSGGVKTYCAAACWCSVRCMVAQPH